MINYNFIKLFNVKNRVELLATKETVLSRRNYAPVLSWNQFRLARLITQEDLD
jgi:hypothetical protein